MSQPFDARKSLTTLEQDNTVIAVIEMSQSSSRRRRRQHLSERRSLHQSRSARFNRRSWAFVAVDHLFAPDQMIPTNSHAAFDENSRCSLALPPQMPSIYAALEAISVPTNGKRGCCHF